MNKDYVAIDQAKKEMKQITEKDYLEDDFKALKNVYLKDVDLKKFQPAKSYINYDSIDETNRES